MPDSGSSKTDLCRKTLRTSFGFAGRDQSDFIKRGKAGKKVLRLKGGDPFIFGRGGEELELLVRHQIPFEIIPGVTSASAVPAYAGFRLHIGILPLRSM